MQDEMKNPVLDAAISAVAANPNLLLLSMPSALWTPDLVEACLLNASADWLRAHGHDLLRDAAELNVLNEASMLAAARRLPDSFVELASDWGTESKRRSYAGIWKSIPGALFDSQIEACQRASALAARAPSLLLRLPERLLRLMPLAAVREALTRAPVHLPTVLLAGIELSEDDVIEAAKAAPQIYPALSVLPRGEDSPVVVPPMTITAACWAALSAHQDKAQVEKWLGIRWH